MFWKFNLLTSSHIDALLEKEDVTLRELMDESDILQECKAQNRKLINFLIQPENMEDMINMITKEPEEDVAERLRFKYPNTACELLTADVSEINDKLADDRELIDQLYSFLESDRPLNPLLASFFSRVMGVLVARKGNMIFEYLKGQKDFVGRLLHHMGTSAIMDLLFRLITCIELPETRIAVVEWLNENQLIQRLVDCLVPTNDEDMHCNVAQSLCDIARFGQDQMMQVQNVSDPDPLSKTIELKETISKVLRNMFDLEQNESVVVNGLFIMQTLVDAHIQRQTELNGQVASNGHSQGISSLLAAIVPRLKHFHALLLTPPKQRYSMIRTSVCTMDPPVGNTRLQVTRLIAALLANNIAAVNIELVNLNTLQALLDLYFRYRWNNFLHTQVVNCITLVLTNPPAEIDGVKEQPLLEQLFTDCQLPQRLLDEWEENDRLQIQEGQQRRGHMGHLTKIANTLSAAGESGCNCEIIKELWTEVPEECKQKWDAFVLGPLADVNRRNNAVLGVDSHNPFESSSDDGDIEFKDIQFPQETSMQQAFTDYQLQDMMSNLIEQFTEDEDEFEDTEQLIDIFMPPETSDIRFEIEADRIYQSFTLANQINNFHIKQFDDDDDDEDIRWDDDEHSGNASAQRTISGQDAEDRGGADSTNDSTRGETELELPSPTPQHPSVATAVLPHSSSSHPFLLASDGMKNAGCSAISSSTSGESNGPLEPHMIETKFWESEAAQAGLDLASDQHFKANVEDDWADVGSFWEIGKFGQSPRCSSPCEMDSSGSPASVHLSENDRCDPGDSCSVESTDRCLGQTQQSFGDSDVKVENLDQQPVPDSSSQCPPKTLFFSSAAEAADVISSTCSEAESQEPAGGEVNVTEAGAADTVSAEPSAIPVEDSSISASGADNCLPAGTGLVCMEPTEVKCGAGLEDQLESDGKVSKDLFKRSADVEEVSRQPKTDVELVDSTASSSSA